jgi:hypothetical protein
VAPGTGVEVGLGVPVGEAEAEIGGVTAGVSDGLLTGGAL